MTKILGCIVAPGECDFRARGERDEDVVQEAAAHAKNEHNMQITPDLVEQARMAIREE